jgi:ABC-2 type transport system ATP-binding protein
VGRNGAGKSTLLRCAAGWSAPGSGSIEVLGRALRGSDRELRRQIVLVTDTPPFYDDLTGREHLTFVLRANRMESRLGEAERLLAAFGIDEAASTYPSTFSRGMRYKLALTMALALAPRLLLLDEPFGPVDPFSAQGLWTELQTAARGGAAVLFSSHQLPEGAVPDRYAVMEAGRIVAAGTAAEAAAPDGALDLDAVLRATLERVGASADA